MRKTLGVPVLGLLLLLAPLALAACVRPPAPALPPRAVNEVFIVRYSFDPNGLLVKAGDTVTWLNFDTDTHTVTGEDWDSGYLDPGGAYSRQFDSVGAYTYICFVHPFMADASIVVTETGPGDSGVLVPAAKSRVPIVFGKPVTVWLGMLTLLSLLTTVSIGLVIQRGIARIPFGYHRAMAITTLALATLHGGLAFWEQFLA